ncbi:hypothetical protein DL770_009386 [Monosporascus sp. CRB-9-2]|nr:hypothetical protein DL770_009386 [Monosporascus sp. CRB-9-2]
MDAIKNAIGSKSDASRHTSNKQSSSGQPQDYDDKGKSAASSLLKVLRKAVADRGWLLGAFKAVNDKAGWGLNESQREQITDFGRNAYQQKSGNKVDPKISNRGG